MPMVGGGMEETLRLLMQMSQQNQARGMQQTSNLLQMAQPGQTLKDLGIDSRAMRRYTGQKNVDLNIAPVALTPDYLINQQRVQQIRGMSPDQLSILATSATMRDLGTPQVTTVEGMEATARSNTTKAKAAEVSNRTILDLVTEGQQSIAQAPKQQRAIAGQQAIMGTTLTQLTADETAAKLKNELTREALAFAASPNTHKFGVLLKSKLNIDPVAAVAAVGTGMTQMLHDANALMIARVTNAGQRETEIAKQFAAAAGDLSKATGYKINPGDVYTVWNMRMQGKDPGTVKGLADVSRIMDATAEVNFRAAVAEGMKRADPNVANLEQMLGILRNAKDRQTVVVASTLARQSAGVITATQLYGPRPLGDPNARGADAEQIARQQRIWDQAAVSLGNMTAGVIENENGLFNFGRLEATGPGMPGAGGGTMQVQAGGPQQAAPVVPGRPQGQAGPAPAINPASGLGQFMEQTGAGQSTSTLGPKRNMSVNMPANTPPDVQMALEQFLQAYLQMPPTP